MSPDLVLWWSVIWVAFCAALGGAICTKRKPRQDKIDPRTLTPHQRMLARGVEELAQSYRVPAPPPVPQAAPAVVPPPPAPPPVAEPDSDAPTPYGHRRRINL